MPLASAGSTACEVPDTLLLGFPPHCAALRGREGPQPRAWLQPHLALASSAGMSGCRSFKCWSG